MNEKLTVMIRTIAFFFFFLTWNDKCEIWTWEDSGLRFLFFLTFNSVIEICYFIPVHNLFNVLYKGTQTVTDVFSLFYSEVVNKKTIFIIQLLLPLSKEPRFTAVRRLPSRFLARLGSSGHPDVAAGAMGAPSSAQEPAQVEPPLSHGLLGFFGFIYKHIIF